MKSRLLTIVLATLTVGLLGSCSKINERIDGLDRRTYNIENNQIASVNQQVAAIKASIADLETIRTDLKTVMDAKAAQGEDIKDLKAADELLEGKIDELNTYVDTELAKYATTEWANATFATLEKQAEIITDVTKLKTDIAGFDATLDEALANLDTSLKSWVNEQLSAYYTAAQMDAKVKALQDEIDALKTAGETDETKIEGLETKLTQVAQDLAAAKESIKTAYEKAIKDAIEGNDGYITETIKNAIADVNGKITDITGRVDTLDTTVGVLTGRIDAIEAMIQTVTIVPVYDDGSVEATNGVLELNLIVSPAGAVKGLTKENVNILVNTVLTKAVSVDTVKTENISSFIVDEANGTVEIKADINENLPSEEGQALTVAVNVQNGISDYTTEFVPVTAIVITPYVEIAAKYDGSTVSTLRWYKQSLAITESGKKAWKDGSGSAVKVPGTDEDVVVGDFFPWGAFAGFYGGGADSDKGLLPYTGFTNKGCGDASDSFTFKTDKQFDAANSPYFSGSAYTKYNTTDKKTTLDVSDDAASIILGGTWRMPTSSEFQAMKEATYWAWDATDNGYYVYTPNPASDAGKVNDGAGKYNKSRALLFYPAAGYGNTTVLTSAYGYYQSSTLWSISPDYADYMNFSDNSVNPENYNYRFIGMSIRPVQDPAAEYVAVTEVKFDVTAKEVEAGGNAQLNVVVTPSTATQPGVYWKSSDETVATVDATGKVKGVGEGTATITATTVDGGKTATCTVTVTPAKPYAEIAAKYDGSTVSTLRWYKQSLAITDSGKKAWTGGSGSAVKVPGTDEDVVVGDYFQWGTFTGFYGNGAGTDKGLLPYTSFTSTGCGDGSDDFTFKDGKQFDQTNAPYWSGSAYTKYNATDKKTELDASDDVASIILGGTWRMPTTKEFQALKEVTYWAWDETDNGYYVYTPNPASDAGKVNNGTGTYDKSDAQLFFPTAGNGYEETYYDVTNIADYWYGSLNSESIGSACHLFFNSSGGFNADSRDSQRFRGFSVRPVQDPAAEYVAVTEVKFDVTAKEVVAGGNVQLSATVTPDDATNKGVYWTSDTPAVATVDPYGKVTAVAAGTATITATTVNGSMTATCTVTVKTPVTTFKAVYDTNGGANTLTFYYDAVDHSGNGITVYEDGTTNYLFDDKKISGVKWGYNEKRGEIKSVVIDASVAGYKGLTSTAAMFQGMAMATNISGAEYLDVSNVTDMNYMFSNFGGGKSGSPTTLNVVPDVSKWNTSNVKYMNGMFDSYGNFSSSLDKVPDVSDWNTGNVINMDYMFQKYGYGSQTFNAVPDVSKWNTGNVTTMKDMFFGYGFKSTALNAVPDVSNWNTGNVTNMFQMFISYGNSSTALNTVPNVSNWNTGNVTNMENLFYGYGHTSTNISCVLDLSGWNLANVTSGEGVFGFKQIKTFSVTIPAKTGVKANDASHWYYGDGTNSIAPPKGKTFTPAAP